MASPAKRRRISDRQSLSMPSRAVTASQRVTNGLETERLLGKLSKDSLARLAREWLQDGSATGRGKERVASDDEDEDLGNSDSDEGEGDEEAAAKVKRRLTIRYSDTSVASLSKPALIDRILRDWRAGLTLSQLAAADIAAFAELPAGKTGKRWDAHELLYESTGPRRSAGVPLRPKELEARLQEAVDLFPACHVHVSAPYEGEKAPLHIRLAILPPMTSSTSPSKTKTQTVHLLHFPSTPFILLPATTKESHRQLISEALLKAFSRPPGRGQSGSSEKPMGIVKELKKLGLTGSDWVGMREMLIESREGASGGNFMRYRKEDDGVPDAEDGQALAPKARRRSVDPNDAKGPDYVAPHESCRIIMDDHERKDARDKEVGAVFGWKALPSNAHISWDLPLSQLVGEEAMQGVTLDEIDDVFKITLDGTDVFGRLRNLVQDGHTDVVDDKGEVRCRGLPEWMHEAFMGGESVVHLEEAVQEGGDETAGAEGDE